MGINEVINAFIEHIFSFIALLFSFFSLHESRKVNKVQLRLNEMEEKLKKYELEEIEKIREAANKTMLEATICKISKGRYKLKILNSGQAIAYNVDYEIPIELGEIVIRDKAPFEKLESGKSFEELIAYYMGIPSKFTIKMIWKDENGERYEKEQLITF